MNKSKVIDLLSCCGSKSATIIEYMLTSARADTVNATQREMAKTLGVSLPLVTSTINKMESAGLIKKERSGCYKLLL